MDATNGMGGNDGARPAGPSRRPGNKPRRDARPPAACDAMGQAPNQLLLPIMTTDEVAALLRCEPATVQRYVHNHKLVAIQIGRERRFRAEDVLEFIATRPTTQRSNGRMRRQNLP